MVQQSIILGNKIPLKIMSFFSDYPKEVFYAEQVREKLKIAKGSVIKWLHTLQNSHILEETRVGGTIQYYLNTNNFFVKELRKLFILSDVWDLVESLKDVCDEIYLFGSCARGEYFQDSDIDLLLLTKVNRSQVFSKLGKIRLKREVKPVILSQLEYSMLSRKDPAFYSRIEKDKVRLL